MNNTKIVSFLASQARKRPRVADLLSRVSRETFGDRLIFLDFPVKSVPRWTNGNPHQELWNIINDNRSHYAGLLESFLPFTQDFVKISERQNPDISPTDPYWINGWMPALDGVALYSLMAIKKPKRFLEVGSGNSTKFARRAINDHQLDTKIISIDPQPRAEVDMICDSTIRKPVEDVSLDIFDQLESGDILTSTILIGHS